nr:MAG TPA: hypothetical protein [Caudoviricetes sp.]
MILYSLRLFYVVSECPKFKYITCWHCYFTYIISN